MVQLVFIPTLSSQNERTVCYEVVNLRKSIKLSKTDLTLFDLSYIKMKIDQVEIDNPRTQEYVLKKQISSCYESFHFGKDVKDSQKTNITISLYPIRYGNPFEKFIILLLSNPTVATTSVEGLEGKYSLSFNLQNYPTKLDSQGVVNVPSSIPASANAKNYCMFGQTRGFLGFYEVNPSTAPFDTFGQITIDLAVKENGHYITKDSYVEPFELSVCDEKEKGALHVIFKASEPVLLSFSMEINGRKEPSTSPFGDEGSDKVVLLRNHISMKISYGRIHLISESDSFSDRDILLVYESKRTVNCRINSQEASYTEDFLDQFVFRTRSIQFKAVDTDRKYLVAGRMDQNDKLACYDQSKYAILRPSTNQ